MLKYPFLNIRKGRTKVRLAENNHEHKHTHTKSLVNMTNKEKVFSIYKLIAVHTAQSTVVQDLKKIVENII